MFVNVIVMTSVVDFRYLSHRTTVKPVRPAGIYCVLAVVMLVCQPFLACIVWLFNFFLSLSAARPCKTTAVKKLLAIIQRRHIGALGAKRFTEPSEARGPRP